MIHTSSCRRGVPCSVVSVVQHDSEGLPKEAKTEPKDHIPDLAALKQFSRDYYKWYLMTKH